MYIELCGNKPSKHFLVLLTATAAVHWSLGYLKPKTLFAANVDVLKCNCRNNTNKYKCSTL
jgi:hypothetical protein